MIDIEYNGFTAEEILEQLEESPAPPQQKRQELELVFENTRQLILLIDEWRTSSSSFGAMGRAEWKRTIDGYEERLKACLVPFQRRFIILTSAPDMTAHGLDVKRELKRFLSKLKPYLDEPAKRLPSWPPFEIAVQDGELLPNPDGTYRVKKSLLKFLEYNDRVDLTIELIHTYLRQTDGKTFTLKSIATIRARERNPKK